MWGKRQSKEKDVLVLAKETLPESLKEEQDFVSASMCKGFKIVSQPCLRPPGCLYSNFTPAILNLTWSLD